MQFRSVNMLFPKSNHIFSETIYVTPKAYMLLAFAEKRATKVGINARTPVMAGEEGVCGLSVFSYGGKMQ